jgi:hypothetical protein
LAFDIILTSDTKYGEYYRSIYKILGFTPPDPVLSFRIETFVNQGAELYPTLQNFAAVHPNPDKPELNIDD